jgi:hypothetical protein
MNTAIAEKYPSSPPPTGSAVGVAFPTISATIAGERFGIPAYHLGITWLVPTFGVPALTVAQFRIVAVLLNAGRRKYAEAHLALSQHIPDRLVAHIS